jgi:hypothetical protein
MTLQVLILGAGPPSSGNAMPVWLAEQNGEILIERFVRACARLDAKLIFAVRAQDISRFRLDSVIELAAPGASIVPISGETQGAACTALLCVPCIAPNESLLILNSNEFLAIDYREAVAEFEDRGLDAGVVVFSSLHPRYSYVRVDADGLIIEAAEKHPISRHATAGFYWYRRGADFIDAAKEMIRKDAHHEGRFYISLAFNELVLKQRRMGIVEVASARYQPLKSQRHILNYEAAIDEEIAP